MVVDVGSLSHIQKQALAQRSYYGTLVPYLNGGLPAVMTPQEFIVKWQRANLSERSAAQQHFLDLCDLLGQPKPAAADPDGTWYTFEKGVETTAGGKGWADAWMRDHFGWEQSRRPPPLASYPARGID